MIIRQQIDAQMRALVGGHGCLDAAAEAVNARWGTSVCKGTLSRRMSSDLPWTILDVIALEDALGRYPVTRMMTRRIEDNGPGDVVSAAQVVAKETGEAVAALMGAMVSASSSERAHAIVEIDEAIEALRQARSALETMSERGGGK